MRTANPNLPLLESVVAALGPLCPRFVFVGGCVTGLLITEAATPPVRTTRDVDVIVEVVSESDSRTADPGAHAAPVTPSVSWWKGGTRSARLKN